MSIGTTIKRLRKEKDLTQEQLAEYLGISAQAISGWECDKCAPDVYQISVLAQIFNVSADVILEINANSIEIEIQNFLKRYDELGNSGDGIEKFELTKEMYKKYPSDFRVIEKYILELFYDPHHKEEPFGETVHKAQIQKLCEIVIRDCTIQQIRYTAYDILSVIYINSGDINKAKEICSYFPNSYFDTESELLEQLYCRTDGKMYTSKMRENILDVTEHLVNKLRNLATFGTNDKLHRIAIYKKCIEILNIIYDGEDSGFMLYHKGNINCLIAKALFDLEDHEAGLHYMQEGFKYCSKYDGQVASKNQMITHRSVVLKDVIEDLSQVYNTVKDTRVGWEIKEFNAFSKNKDLPKEYFDILEMYS